MSDDEHRQEDEAAEAPGEGSEARRAAAEAEGDGTAPPDAGAPERSTVSVKSGGADVGTADRGADADEAQAGFEPPGATTASVEDELAEARRAATEHLDRALRAQAELENVRRRLERDLQNAHKFALERFVSELLPVKDSLELGLAASTEKEASPASIAEGVELTLRMLEQVMAKFGITVVDPAGEPFDPEFHQAMTMQQNDSVESGTVLTVVQKGYLLNERLVRPAMVIVAK